MRSLRRIVMVVGLAALIPAGAFAAAVPQQVGQTPGQKQTQKAKPAAKARPKPASRKALPEREKGAAPGSNANPGPPPPAVFNRAAPAKPASSGAVKYVPKVQLPTVSRESAMSQGGARHFGPNAAVISGSPNPKNGDGSAVNGTHMNRKP